MRRRRSRRARKVCAFRPYLAGERTPHMDPNLRGSFTGLSLRHTWKHLARAVMEGVVFSLADGLELMRDLGANFDQVIASGGGTKHPLWLQLQADVFGLPVRTTQTPEAAAFGAALIAGVGAGVYADVAAACARCVKWSEDVVAPREEMTQLYREPDEAVARLAVICPSLRHGRIALKEARHVQTVDLHQLRLQPHLRLLSGRSPVPLRRAAR